MFMNKGDQVRLKDNPGRTGVVVAGPRCRAGSMKYQVQFPDRADWHTESLLEIENTSNDDALDSFKKGILGRASDLRSNLTLLRLNGRLADLIYSMEMTNTDFYPYQFKPVLNFLDSPSNSILIADEVGLGKTIEAGLIWTELRSRFDAKRLMVICPAMLRDKWSDELDTRFGIKAEILDATQTLQKIKRNTCGAFAIIGSMQGLRPRRNWNNDEDPTQDSSSKLARFLEENASQEPLIDLLIIDEAHYMRNKTSMTAHLGQLFRHVSEHAVLLSATPVNLHSQDLYQLLHLVDEDMFNNPHVFDDTLEANGPLIKARDAVLAQQLLKDDFVARMKTAQEHYLLRSSKQLQELIEKPPSTKQLRNNKFCSELADRLEKLNLLNHAVNRTRKREVNEWRVVREPVSEGIKLSEVEKKFYEQVTDFVTDYCTRRDVPNGFLLAMPQRQMASSMPAALKSWQNRKTHYRELLYEDIGIDEGGHDLAPLVQELTSISGSFEYDELYACDSKYQRLKEMLLDYFNEYKNEKIILFSYFRATLDYLSERLSKDGIVSMKLMGSMPVNKQEFIQEFKEDKSAKILLSSDVASEGVDLQFCRVIINYDLPWNPMKVEQRIGRIDRIGQQAEKITIWNLFYAETIDAKIYDRLLLRLGIFKQSLGGLEPVIGEEIKQLRLDLMTGNLSNQQQNERIEQTQQAIENNNNHTEQLEEQANNLIAHGGYILNQVKAAKELNRTISDNDLHVLVKDFMTEYYTGCEFRQVNDQELLFEIKLSPEAKSDLGEYLRAKSLYGQTRLAKNASSPVSCIFKNKVTTAQTSRSKREMISQFHPLTRFIGYAVKQKNITFHSAVSIKLDQCHCPPELLQGVYCFFIHHWSVEALRDIEKLYFAANLLTANNKQIDSDIAEKLITQAAMYGKDWIEARTTVDLCLATERIDNCMNKADTEYEKYIKQIKNENEDRATIREQQLLQHKERQLTMLKSVKQGHELYDRPALVLATQGKIDALNDRIAIKQADIAKKRNIKNYCREICLGIIEIY